MPGPLVGPAIIGGSTIVASLFQGLLGMKKADEDRAAARELFEKQKEAEFQKMSAQAPMQQAAAQQQGIGGLVNAWGGTIR